MMLTPTKPLRSTFHILVFSILSTHCQYVGSLATIPVWFDSSNHLHRDIQYHPEQPQRITACVQALSRETCVKLIDVAEDPTPLLENGKDCSTVIEATPFTPQALQYAKELLLKTHNPELVTGLEKKCHTAKERRVAEGKDPLGHMGYIDFDTYLTTETWNVVLRATAAWVHAVDEALSLRNGATGASVALTRPPGHHATRNESNGFCVFNFAAAAALHALASSSVQRVSLLDWDVHFGQGVADIVRKHDRLRYVSSHQVPAFPYMGESKGVQDGGNILTLPMPADTTWTCGYHTLFDQALDFVVGDDWQPDLVIVCAGYDALSSDELASCSLSASDFGRMVRVLRQRLPAGTPVMLGLEGGYQLGDVGAAGNLPQAVVETVRALAEETAQS